MTAAAGAAGTEGLHAATRSVAETQDLAARIGPVLGPGDVVLLGGDLGAGKTAFVQGLARALGITEAVTSPTFTLVRTYDNLAGPRLVHADLYRLEHLQEVLDLGLAELVDEGAVAAIEWGPAAAPALAPDYLEVRLDFGEGDDDRTVDLLPVGPRWGAPARVAALRSAVAGVTP